MSNKRFNPAERCLLSIPKLFNVRHSLPLILVFLAGCKNFKEILMIPKSQISEARNPQLCSPHNVIPCQLSVGSDFQSI